MDVWLQFLRLDLDPSPIGLLFPLGTLVVLVIAIAVFTDIFNWLREWRRRK